MVTLEDKNSACFFWPGLGLPSIGLSYHTKNQLLPKPFTKQTSKSAKYACHNATKKRPVKIFFFGLDNIIKLKFRTNFDRSAILNGLNGLTKDIEP